MNKQLCRFTLCLLVCFSVPSIAAAQVEISAVSSANNPAAGDQIEVSINIAGASNVAGYDFTLTFDPTKLEFIGIENADFLPTGAFELPPTVGNGSVKFAAAAATGTDKHTGTLAVATFRVLAKTETAIELEDVEIANQLVQLLEIAAVTGATINSTTSTTDSTTETQVDPSITPSTTTPTTGDNIVSPTTAGQVEISAVSNANNPAVGDQIEVSINIAGALNVAGYDFTLIFDPTKLEFIGIENADFLPTGAFELSPTVGNGSVQFAAAAATGTDKRNGTLAVATFRVLTETETTVRFGEVDIADSIPQTITIASVAGATINRAAPTGGVDLEYLLSIPPGISLIHVPLKVTTVDGVARTIRSITDLYTALGGASTVNFLITYDSQAQEWYSYFGTSDTGTPADTTLTDDKGIIAGMIAPVSVRLSGSALGVAGNGAISLNPGLNLVGLPLRDSRVMRVSNLFALNGIGGNVPAIILTDSGEFKAVGRASDPGDIQITGGQSFILTAQRAATVIIHGDGWTNIR